MNHTYNVLHKKAGIRPSKNVLKALGLHVGAFGGGAAGGLIITQAIQNLTGIQRERARQKAIRNGEKLLRASGLGAGVGGLGGAGLAYILSKKHKGRNAFLAGLLGSGLGAGAGALLEETGVLDKARAGVDDAKKAAEDYLA